MHIIYPYTCSLQSNEREKHAHIGREVRFGMTAAVVVLYLKYFLCFNQFNCMLQCQGYQWQPHIYLKTEPMQWTNIYI